MFTGRGVGWDNYLECQLMESTEVHVHTPRPSVFLARSLPNRNTGARGKDMYEDLLYKTGYNSRKLMIPMLWNTMWVFKVMRLDYLRL